MTKPKPLVVTCTMCTEAACFAFCQPCEQESRTMARESAVKKEVAAIVRWLDSIRFEQPGREAEWTRHIKGAIERGEHLEGGAE